MKEILHIKHAPKETNDETKNTFSLVSNVDNPFFLIQGVKNLLLRIFRSFINTFLIFLKLNSNVEILQLRAKFPIPMVLCSRLFASLILVTTGGLIQIVT